MEMLQIQRVEVPKVQVYMKSEPQDLLVGVFNNEHECNKFRTQMLLKGVTQDYYFMFGDIKITVDEDGNMDKFPRGMYDLVQMDLSNIFRIRQNREAGIPLDTDLLTY
jgi:hypothetical protein